MKKLYNSKKLYIITFSISSIIFLLFSCGILCQTYIEKTCLLYDNSLRFHVRADSDEKERILNELLGGKGKNLQITAPFYVDYGNNIYFGNNCEVNMNCTFLDDNIINQHNHTAFS